MLPRLLTCKPAATSLSDIGRTLTTTLTASLSVSRDLPSTRVIVFG